LAVPQAKTLNAHIQCQLRAVRAVGLAGIFYLPLIIYGHVMQIGSGQFVGMISQRCHYGPLFGMNTAGFIGRVLSVFINRLLADPFL
jgi:hypothetical protein